MAHALGTAIVVACFSTGDLLIKTLASVGVLVLFVNGSLSVYVFAAVGEGSVNKPHG